MSSKSSSSLKFKFDDPNTEVKIVDGELWVKSSTTIMGYLNAEMQNFTTDGWFKTGDLVELDNEGYIYIKGRNNNIINVGGLKVFPQEVESVLMKLPFIENCIVYEFREWDHSGFYTPYVDQIKAAVTNGHDVQLHLHPHWLTSTFNGKEFKPSDDYSLTDFFVEKNGYNIEKIIEEGVGFFNETLTPVSSDYSCNAFRAGGYNLGDDHSRSTILKALHKHGIRYDSSIAKG